MKKFAYLWLFALSLYALSPAARAGSPVVVELFTSQGCPHSPKGDDNLAELSRDPDILALTYPVTYWDYKGWKDTFARKEWDSRQKRYIKSMPGQWLYTPQAVIQGRKGISGEDLPGIQAVLADTSPDGPAMTANYRDGGSRLIVTLDGPAPAGSETVLVLYRPGEKTVTVTEGKNAGQTLRFTNVVQILREGGPDFMLSASEQNLGCAVLLQDRSSGKIYSATNCRR